MPTVNRGTKYYGMSSLHDFTLAVEGFNILYTDPKSYISVNMGAGLVSTMLTVLRQQNFIYGIDIGEQHSIQTSVYAQRKISEDICVKYICSEISPNINTEQKVSVAYGVKSTVKLTFANRIPETLGDIDSETTLGDIDDNMTLGELIGI